MLQPLFQLIKAIFTTLFFLSVYLLLSFSFFFFILFIFSFFSSVSCNFYIYFFYDLLRTLLSELHKPQWDQSCKKRKKESFFWCNSFLFKAILSSRIFLLEIFLDFTPRKFSSSLKIVHFVNDEFYNIFQR